METDQPKFIHVPATKLPVLTQAEVVVVGGGSAGFIAAVASARAGAKTTLVERQGYLSGALSATYASTPGSFGDPDFRQIIAGIGWEFVERMEKAGYARVNRKLWTVQMLPEVSKEIAMAMVTESGVELYLHSWVSEVLVEGGMIKGIIIQTKSGRQVIMGKVFVDASGDADVAAWAGAPFEQLTPDELWQTTVDLTIANIDDEKVLEWGKKNKERVVWMGGSAPVKEPGLGSVISVIVIDPGQNQSHEDSSYAGPVPTIKLMPYHSIGRVQGSVEINPIDVKALTFAEVEARRRAMSHLGYLKRTVPGFENAFVVSESHLGVRESRRIIGDYVIQLQDLLSNARFPDVVALNCRALDRHMKGEIFEIEFLSGYHDIPLRALLPQNVNNLIVAGRCISCDHESHASLRGAATCLATGHAAGAAAGLAAQGSSDVRDIIVADLQSLLIKQGGILKID
jgi:hypothetical protein